MRRLLPALTLILVAAALPASPVGADGASVLPIVLDVDGEPADGLYAEPAGAPTALVVIAHGYGHSAESWRNHLVEMASHGAVAVAMSYPPDFELARGADEIVAATHHFQALHPDVPTFLFAVSMGNPVGGIALAEHPGLFDWYVDVEGIASLAETWAAAKAIGHAAATAIETETGGTPAEVPDAYARRSPALRGAEIAASGIRGAILIHPVNDGLVPYNQGREMAAALAAERVPLHFYNVIRGPCGEQGTTGTGALLGAAPIDNNPLCLAGHGSEASSTHPVMRTGLDALYAIMSGERVPTLYEEFVVDAPDA